MNDAVVQISRTRRFAEAVETEIAGLGDDLPGGRATAEDLVLRARRLRARALRRVSFAAVGEFDAGKSLLMSCLVGVPDLLRASSTPTTANVTAIRLRPGPDDAAPRVRRTSVSFLSRDAVSAMLDDLLAGAQHLVKENALPYAVDALAGLRPLEEGWDRFNRLGAAVWADPALNPELRLRLAELARIRDALAVGENVLAATDPGPLRVVDDSALRGAVEIGNLRTLPERFPVAHAGLRIEPDAELDAATLARVQTLIQRVTYDVEVPPREWAMGGLLVEPGIEFLDMPGINSAGGARDEYLALTELQQVTGLLVVLDARKPEAGSVLKLPTFLERARSSREHLLNSQLVVGNKFDVLPTSANDTQTWSAEFASLQRMADVITKRRPELVSYTSALAALVVRGTRLPPEVPQVSPAAVADNLRHWGDVATARADQPEAEALRLYATDGGIDGLRRRLSGHVLRYGLDIHMTELEVGEADLRKRLAALSSSRQARTPTDGRLGEVLQVWRSDLSDAVRVLRQRIDELQDVDRLQLPDGDGVLAGLRRSIVHAVARWEQWEALYSTVTDQKIEPQPLTPDRDRPGLDGRDLPLDDDEVIFGPGAARRRPRLSSRSVPFTATDFEQPYAAALRDAGTRLGSVVTAVVGQWAADTSRRLREARRVAQDAGLLTLLIDATPGDDREKDIRRARLAALYDLSFVSRACERAVAEVPALSVENSFPLTEGRAFAWHPALIGTRPDEERHQSVVSRMRYTLTSSLVEASQLRLVRVMSALAVDLQRIVGILDAEIPDREELAAITAPLPEASGQGSPPWQGTLHRLLDTETAPSQAAAKGETHG